MGEGILSAAVGAVFHHPHLLLLPATVWLMAGWALLRKRRAAGGGLAGGLAVACGLVWLASWVWEVTEAPIETQSARLIGLGIELIGLFALSVAVGVLTTVALASEAIGRAGHGGRKKP
jgi:hypothetical protein